MERLGKKITNGEYSFLISPEVNAEEFQKTLPRLDDIMRSAPKLKDSRSTTAAVCNVPGCGEVFLKRTNNKSLRFTLRYLFRRARAFRAARAAEILRSAGIETPDVVAVGECRSFLYLRGGYLLNELKKDVTDASCLLLNSDQPERCVAEITEKAAVLLASVHLLNISHGDFKLVNVYFNPDGSCGVWDLDGARVHASLLPRNVMLIDLARLAASIRSVARLRADQYQTDFSETCRAVAKAYSSVSAASAVTGGVIEAAVLKFFPEK